MATAERTEQIVTIVQPEGFDLHLSKDEADLLASFVTHITYAGPGSTLNDIGYALSKAGANQSVSLRVRSRESYTLTDNVAVIVERR